MSEDVEENRNLQETGQQEQMINDDLSDAVPGEIEKPESVPTNNEENKVCKLIYLMEICDILNFYYFCCTFLVQRKENKSKLKLKLNLILIFYKLRKYAI